MAEPRPARRVLLLLAGSGIALVVMPPHRPALVWNASPSAPIGLYGIDFRRRPAIGDRVVAWPPAAVGRLAAARGYLPAGVPLVKRIGAAPGDRVCVIGRFVRVESRVVAVRRPADSHGRRLAGWHGCRQLANDEWLLLGDRPDSFDGRYFGPSRARELIGRATLLWRR